MRRFSYGTALAVKASERTIMTAQAVAPHLPPDPAPAPPAAPETGGGSHFLAVFGAKPSAAAQPAATAAAKDPAGSVPPATRAAALRKLPGAADQADGGAQPTTVASGSAIDAATTVVALPLPLLVQLQQPPAPVVAAAANGTTPVPALALPGSSTNSLPLPALLAATTAEKAVTAAPPATGALATSLPLAAPTGSLPATKLAAAALASAPTPLAQNAVPSLPVASGPSPAPAVNSSAATAPAATAATDPQGANSPPLASTINARLASGAAALVSQPHVALASLAPANDKATAKPTASDGGLPTNSRQLAAQGTHDAADAPVAPGTHTSEQPLTSAKDNLASALASPAAHEPVAHEPAVAPLDNGALNTPSPPPAVPVAQSAPPPNEAPVTLPIIPHAVAEQVAINVHQAVRSGTDHIQIQLQPADLGTIDVKLNVNHDGRVTVVVSADRSDTLNLLQQDAGGLTQALRDAGLQADNSSLSFNLRGGFQFQQQQSAGSGGGPRDGGYLSDGDGGDAIAAPLPNLRRHVGALDIHV
jgi:flagellar hook-length control protein FliK